MIKVKLNRNYMEMLAAGYGQLVGYRSRRRNHQKAYIRKIKQLFLIWWVE